MICRWSPAPWRSKLCSNPTQLYMCCICVCVFMCASVRVHSASVGIPCASVMKRLPAGQCNVFAQCCHCFLKHVTFVFISMFKNGHCMQCGELAYRHAWQVFWSPWHTQIAQWGQRIHLFCYTCYIIHEALWDHKRWHKRRGWQKEWCTLLLKTAVICEMCWQRFYVC